jgi:hypothetical protein
MFSADFGHANRFTNSSAFSADLPPTTVDRQRVPTACQLDDLRHAPIAPLFLYDAFANQPLTALPKHSTSFSLQIATLLASVLAEGTAGELRRDRVVRIFSERTNSMPSPFS